MYSIKELVQLTGIKAHTIRIWEQRYELLEPSRSDTNIRKYSDAELKKLLNISFLNKNGLKIGKIASLNEKQINSKVKELAFEKMNDEDQVVQFLTDAVLLFDSEQFRALIDSYVLANSIEIFFEKIIPSYFKNLGILWQINIIRPAQEHFSSQILSEYLIAKIHALPKVNNPKKKCVLFLHQNEMHEFGILYAYYLLAKTGIQVTYLGPMVPTEDLKLINDKLQPNFILTSYVKNQEEDWFNQYSKTLLSYFPHSDILIGGIYSLNLKIEDDRLIILREIGTLNSYISSKLI